MIKLIVSDVDGTLVPEGTNDIHPEIFNIIRKLKKLGIYFVVASGRHKSCIDKMFEPVKEDIFYVTSNGAYIGTYNKQMAVFDLEPEVYKQLFHDFDTEIKQPYYAETTQNAYSKYPDPSFIEFMNTSYGYDMKACTTMDIIDEPIIKTAFRHSEGVSNIDPKWFKKWNKLCKAVISGSHWVDFIPLNINKGTSVSKLQELLGVTIHETLAFGDQVNDIEMLKQAYYSFAVDNASSTVKKAARFTCDSCADQGVLKTLNQIFSECL